MKTSYIILIFLILSLSTNSQNLEPMDVGFRSWNVEAVHKIQVSPIDSQIYVGGIISETKRGTPMRGITKWLPDIERWDSLTFENNYSQFCRVFNFYNGELYGAGGLSSDSFSVNQGESFCVWNGLEWEAFQNGPNLRVVSSKVIDDKLYLLGSFYEVGSVPTAGLTYYDGEGFHPFPIEGIESDIYLTDIEKYEDEIYIVGRNLTGWPNYDWRGLVKLVADTFQVVHEEFTGLFFQMWLYSLDQYQDELIIGGLFHTEQGFTSNGIQAFDGENMHSLGGGVNAPIMDMKVYKGELYVAGKFGRIGEGVEWLEQNGELCIGLAKWNGESWTCLNTESFGSLGGYFNTIEIYNDTLYVGGSFRSIGGDTLMSNIARMRIYPDTILSIEETSAFDFTIYPNPTNGELNIDFGKSILEEGNVRIYNSIGQLILHRDLEVGYRSFDFSSDYPVGLYTIQIQLGESILNKKVMFIE